MGGGRGGTVAVVAVLLYHHALDRAIVEPEVRRAGRGRDSVRESTAAAVVDSPADYDD